VRRDLWVEPLPGARRRHRKEKREILFAVFMDDLPAERRHQLSDAMCAHLEWGLWHLRPVFKGTSTQKRSTSTAPRRLRRLRC
jgi:hypothetical protein